MLIHPLFYFILFYLLFRKDVVQQLYVFTLGQFQKLDFMVFDIECVRLALCEAYACFAD